MNNSDIINEINRGNDVEYSKLVLILNTMEKRWDYFRENTEFNKLQKFLYSACLRFNRFSVPTPFVLEENSKILFQRFLELLKRGEKSNLNTAVLECDKILWEVFDLIVSKGEIDNLKVFIRTLKKIGPPNQKEKRVEFLEHKEKLKSYISGYLNSSLKTRIDTVIPVSPVRNQTKIKTFYQGFRTEILLQPKYFDTSQSFLKTSSNNMKLSHSDSNWQNSICEVEITIFGLIDPIQPSPALSLPYPNTMPIQSWPSIFNEVYFILESLSWKLNSNKEIVSRWLINPSDLGRIKWEVFANNIQVESILKDPPSQIHKVSNISHDINVVEIPKIEDETPWYIKCLKVAKGKLSLGETNESLFWLNVGIESLFEIRANKMMDDNDMDYQSLNSGRSYWLSAKELIEEQYPEVSEKIKWPESAVGVPSWYTKIKFLDTEIGFAASKKEIIKNYSKINKYRNSLFHGAKSSRVESAKVEKAMNSYNWLIDNFMEQRLS